MNPFLVSPNCEALVERYPDAGSLWKALGAAPKWERECFVRLWLMEGIPYAFRDKPFFYESLRVLLGERLAVAPREVAIAGSGRIGYSLAPKKYGRAFSAGSDFDVLIVSQTLFGRLSADLHRWLEEYAARQVQPRNEKEAEYWVDNARYGPGNAKRGFVDQWKIPNLGRYPAAQAAWRAMAEARQRLARASESLRVKNVSVRVYRDWEAATHQSLLNLSLLTDRKPAAGPSDAVRTVVDVDAAGRNTP